MKKLCAFILQIITIIFGVVVFIFLLWEPNIEGRNAHATLYQIYFHDPFLVYAYLGSIVFFVMLYQIFKLLGHFRQNHFISTKSIIALNNIKRCSIGLMVYILPSVAYLVIVRPGDDIAGGVAIGSFISILLLIVAISAKSIDKIIQRKLIVVFNQIK